MGDSWMVVLPHLGGAGPSASGAPFFPRALVLCDTRGSRPGQAQLPCHPVRPHPWDVWAACWRGISPGTLPTENSRGAPRDEALSPRVYRKKVKGSLGFSIVFEKAKVKRDSVGEPAGTPGKGASGPWVQSSQGQGLGASCPLMLRAGSGGGCEREQSDPFN